MQWLSKTDSGRCEWPIFTLGIVMSKELLGSGFVAGTLVHTDKGLVPIEQLKVGYRVLSRPENSPDAPNEYKQVINTFKSAEKKKIIRVAYHRPEVMDKTFIDKLIADNYDYEWTIYDSRKLPTTDELYLYCTEDHPFWTKEAGLVTAVNLECNTKESVYYHNQYTLINYQDIPLLDAGSTFSTPLKRTSIPDVAVQTNDNDRSTRCHEGEIYSITDFRSGRPILIDLEGRIEDGWSKEQEFIKLSEASEDFRLPFTEAGNFYIGSAVYGYEMGHYKSYEELSDDIHLTREQLQEFNKKAEDSQYYLATVYNIEVADFHTYFVGVDGVWIHNSNGCLNVGVALPTSPKVTKP